MWKSRVQVHYIIIFFRGKEKVSRSNLWEEAKHKLFSILTTEYCWHLKLHFVKLFCHFFCKAIQSILFKYSMYTCIFLLSLVQWIYATVCTSWLDLIELFVKITYPWLQSGMDQWFDVGGNGRLMASRPKNRENGLKKKKNSGGVGAHICKKRSWSTPGKHTEVW